MGTMTKKDGRLVRASAAVLLGVATLPFLKMIASSVVIDWLTVPGALLGTVGSIAGLYDVPSGRWATACIGGDALFYSASWWVVLELLTRWQKPRQKA